MEEQIIMGVVGLVVLVLIVRMFKGESGDPKGKSDSHCFSIKNIRYTMMNPER